MWTAPLIPLDRFARMVATILDVPMALVSLVDDLGLLADLAASCAVERRLRIAAEQARFALAE